MKVLIITGMFPPNRTGTSFYSKNLAEALTRIDVEVVLITTTNKNIILKDECYPFTLIRIPAFHIPLRNYFKHLRFCSLIPWNYIRIKRIIKSFNPEVILLINHYLDIAFLAIFAARIARVPLYISVGTQLQSLNNFQDKILHFFDKLIVGNLIFPFATRIISWDKEIERYIKDVHTRINANKSVIIPFGVNGDIKYYENFHNSYNDSKQILGIGAVIGHRDYIYQIKVFKELLKTFPELTFKIIGNQYIKKPAQIARELGIIDRVIFTGEIPHEEVLKEYQKSIVHWMMLCGEYIGLGTSTIEAMLMGVPVVSNVPGNLFGDDQLRDMHNYLFTDGKDIQKDVYKISCIITNYQLRKRIGKNGQEFVRNYLNWDVIAEQYKHYLIKDIQINSQ